MIEGIGTICHEFTHCLGLPDIYDTAYGGGYGMGYWDLMNSGSYNSNGYIPAGFTSYEKMYCGWSQPIELKNDTVITGMKPLSEGGESYIIYNDANRNEYYLLENRQKTGWDAGIPGNGLLVIHVDYDPTLTPDFQKLPKGGKRRLPPVSGFHFLTPATQGGSEF